MRGNLEYNKQTDFIMQTEIVYQIYQLHLGDSN